MNDSRLRDKVAIVTGAATGIGRACAIRLAAEGAAVAVNYVTQPDKAQETVSQAQRNGGGKVVAIQGDVSKEEDVKKLVEETVRQLGRVDIMVNNAGIEKEVPFLEMPLHEFDHIIAVDLRGPWLCSQEAAKRMVSQGGGGRIINISSVHEDLPMPTNAPYCAAKGGLRMLMRTISVELAPHKITVNNIAPGAIDTPLDKETKEDPKKHKALLEEIPLDRMGQPEEIAGLCAFLASDEAAYVTGSTYVMDGGMMRHSKSL